MSPKITRWKGNLKSVWLPKLPSRETVGWIKRAALREALDSFLIGAVASQPVPRSIPGCFGAAWLERSPELPLCGTVWPRKGSAWPRQEQEQPLVLAAPLPHIPGRPERNSSAPRGRVPAFVCHFGEMRLNVSLPPQPLPCQHQPSERQRQRQAVFCVGPGSCALQVAEASAF